MTPYIGTVAQAPRLFASAATSQVITGLTNGTAYTFAVSAVNARGTGPATTTPTAIIVGTPTAPGLVTATAGAGNATVTWSLPSSNNGAAITGYIVTPFKAGVAQTPVTFNATALTRQIIGLTPGSAYTFRVVRDELAWERPAVERVELGDAHVAIRQPPHCRGDRRHLRVPAITRPVGNSGPPRDDYPTDPVRPRLRNPTMRRMLFVPAAALFGVLLVAGPAWAHNEFDPDQAGTGKVVQLQLSVENEQADAGTTQVQLFFPEGVAITLVDLPAVAGWTTAVEGGAIGAPVTSVTWSRPTASPDENPLLPLTIGPMPADPVRCSSRRCRPIRTVRSSAGSRIGPRVRPSPIIRHPCSR